MKIIDLYRKSAKVMRPNMYVHVTFFSVCGECFMQRIWFWVIHIVWSRRVVPSPPLYISGIEKQINRLLINIKARGHQVADAQDGTPSTPPPPNPPTPSHTPTVSPHPAPYRSSLPPPSVCDGRFG